MAAFRFLDSGENVDNLCHSAIPNATELSLRVQLQCMGSRGAALIVHKPQYWTLPHDQGIYKLLKEKPDPLDGKYIVTEVIKCPAYVLYLSNKSALRTIVIRVLY